MIMVRGDHRPTEHVAGRHPRTQAEPEEMAVHTPDQLAHCRVGFFERRPGEVERAASIAGSQPDPEGVPIVEADPVSDQLGRDGGPSCSIGRCCPFGDHFHTVPYGKGHRPSSGALAGAVLAAREHGGFVAPSKTSREDWVRVALDALSEGGPDAVRVEDLARRLGVTKGGFYWGFDDRSALLDEMLATWERIAVDDVVRRVEAVEGGAVDKLQSLFAEATSARELAGIELAVRDWARRDPAVGERLRRVDDRRMDYMRSLFGVVVDDPIETEARCLLALTFFIGSQFTAPRHGGFDRKAVWDRALQVLEGPSGNSPAPS